MSIEHRPWLPAHEHAVKVYRGPQYWVINEMLRGQLILEDPDRARGIVDELDTALRDSETTAPAVVWRYVNQTPRLPTALSTPGESWHEPGYLSTVADPLPLAGFLGSKQRPYPEGTRWILFRIAIPRSTNALIFDSPTKLLAEVLLPRDQHLQAEDADSTGPLLPSDVMARARSYAMERPMLARVRALIGDVTMRRVRLARCPTTSRTGSCCQTPMDDLMTRRPGGTHD